MCLAHTCIDVIWQSLGRASSDFGKQRNETIRCETCSHELFETLDDEETICVRSGRKTEISGSELR